MSADTALASLIEELEQDRSLDEPRHLRQRTEALEALDGLSTDEQNHRNSNFITAADHLRSVGVR